METHDTLTGLRAEIDKVDAQIVALMARRLAIVDRVVAVKQRDGLPALIPERVEEVVTHVRSIAMRTGTPPDLVEAVWRRMIDWIVAYEHDRLPRNPVA